jgi:phosphoglycolate phosphatase-like HAD superfamily hydrolase
MPASTLVDEHGGVMRVSELTERDHVLVAFDGPVVEMPALGSTAERLRVLVADARLPRKVARSDDPMVVLAYAATIGPATERAVYAQWRRIEYEAVATGWLAVGVEDAFAAMAAVGTQITVVSSLAIEVARSFLVLHGLQEHARHIVGRGGPDRVVLPDLIAAAIQERATPVESCLFVGSTDSDLAAGRAAGVDTVRHVRPPVAEPPAAANPWFDALSAPVSRQPTVPGSRRGSPG